MPRFFWSEKGWLRNGRFQVAGMITIKLPHKIVLKKQEKSQAELWSRLKLIAVQDRNHHNKPILATNVTKIFYLCKEISGEFVPNDETDACDYFALDNLPKLSLDRNTKEQIEMFENATKDPNWETVFE